MSEHWTLGVLIGLPITVFGVIALLLVGIWLLVRARDSYDPPMCAFGGVFTLTVALLLGVGVLGFGFYPYSSDYHKWKPVSGTVSSNTAVAIQTSWVIQFEGSSVKYDCLETRCADMAPGHDVTLLCIHRFVWGGTDWIECKYGEG